MRVFERVKHLYKVLQKYNVLNYLLSVLIMGLTFVVLQFGTISDNGLIILSLGVICVFFLGAKTSPIIISFVALDLYLCYRDNNVFNESRYDFVRNCIIDVCVLFTCTVAKIVLEKRTTELKKLLLRDRLTGLYNADAFGKHLKTYVGKNVLVSLMNLDDFSYFNDSNGRPAGDRTLAIVASLIKSAFGNAVNYRYEGDEFLTIWLFDDEKSYTNIDYSDLINKIRDIPFEGTDQRMYLSFSAGYTWGHVETAEDMQDLIRFATRLLNKSKSLGKNRISFEKYRKEVYGDELRNNINSIYNAAESDKLTGLPDSVCFFDRASRIIQFQQDANVPVVMVYFNIVNFKSVNEKKGYNAGNEVIENFCKTIRNYFATELICRVHAENFLLITFDDGISEKVLNIYKDIIDFYPDMKLVVKAGICYATLENHISVSADRAKLAADSIKDNYEKVYAYYNQEQIGKRLKRQDYIINNLDTALEKGYIKVFYQPVVRVFSRELCGYEALVRWDDPSFGFLSPADFINDLEKFHLIHKIDEYVVKSVCSRLRERMNEGLPVVPVSINLSRLDFDLCDIYQIVSHAVAVNRVPKNFLEIEVTEEGVTQDPEHLKEEIKKFRNNGFEVWLDDFGSGYSSLNVLKDYNFDVLKIDMKFLSDFSVRSKKIITSIVDMAKKVGIQTLAEGVETEEHFEFLKSIGCEMAQGYNFGKPLKEDEAFANIAAQNILIESLDSRLYNEDIGRVNLLSNSSTNFANGNAWAIIEFNHNSLHFLQVNDLYIAILSSLGASNVKQADALINDKNRPIGEAFFNFVEKATLSPDEESIDFYDSKMFFYMAGRNIAHHKDKDAYLVTLSNLSSFREFNKHNLMDENISFLYSIYDRVDLVDLATEEITGLYSSSDSLSAIKTDSLDEYVEYFSRLVYPGDREKFNFVVQISYLKRVLEEKKYTFIDEYFRVRNGNNEYEWKSVLFVGNINNDKNQLLVCIRSADSGKISETFAKDNIPGIKSDSQIIPDAIIWQNILQGTTGCVFWKDKDRKYAGANHSFMQYFGLTDKSAFIGRSDDEIGWCVNGELCRASDEDVLAGKTVVNIVEDCICEGVIKSIVVSKMPIFDDGTIVGIVGQFSVAENFEKDMGLLTSVEFHDPVTDCLNSRGFYDSLLRFEEVFDAQNIDFNLIAINIDNYEQLKAEQSAAFVDEVLKRVSEVITNTMGSKAVIARVSKDNFYVIHKCEDHSEADVAVKAIKDAVSAVNEIGGKPWTVYTSIGTALYSEVQSIDELKKYADIRKSCEKAVHGLAVMSDDEMIINSKKIKYTRKELAQLMSLYKTVFDVVRLVNPSSRESFEPVGLEGSFSDGVCCHEMFNRDVRCVNCISAKTVISRSSQSKFDVVGNDVYYIFTKYVEVDGEPYSLEFIKKVREDIFLEGVPKEQFLHALNVETEKKYKDNVSNLFNRLCYDEQYSKLIIKNVAALKVYGENIDENVNKIAFSLSKFLEKGEIALHYEKDLIVFLMNDNETALLMRRIESFVKSFEDNVVSAVVSISDDVLDMKINSINAALSKNDIKSGSVKLL